MKKRFATLLFILIMLVACNGGLVGPMGPPGPSGAPGECTDSQCEVPEGIITEIMILQSGLEAVTDRVDVIEANPGGGGTAFTREVEVDIYCDGAIMNADAIKDVKAAVKGDVFTCQFKIDNGGRVNEPCNAFYCIPRSDGQPSGYAEWFNGAGRYLGGVGSHGRSVECTSEWKRPEGVSGFGLRVRCPGYDPFTDSQLQGGKQYVGKRRPWLANTDDHWIATNVIP